MTRPAQYVDAHGLQTELAVAGDEWYGVLINWKTRKPGGTDDQVQA
jgi:hypothetical protein